MLARRPGAFPGPMEGTASIALRRGWLRNVPEPPPAGKEEPLPVQVAQGDVPPTTQVLGLQVTALVPELLQRKGNGAGPPPAPMVWCRGRTGRRRAAKGPVLPGVDQRIPDGLPVFVRFSRYVVKRWGKASRTGRSQSGTPGAPRNRPIVWGVRDPRSSSPVGGSSWRRSRSTSSRRPSTTSSRAGSHAGPVLVHCRTTRPYSS